MGAFFYPVMEDALFGEALLFFFFWRAPLFPLLWPSCCVFFLAESGSEWSLPFFAEISEADAASFFFSFPIYRFPPPQIQSGGTILPFPPPCRKLQRKPFFFSGPIHRNPMNRVSFPFPSPQTFSQNAVP